MTAESHRDRHRSDTSDRLQARCRRSRDHIQAELVPLRFVKPVGIGDTIRARLACQRKIDRPTKKDQAPQGVVAWDVQVTNQNDELVAS